MRSVYSFLFTIIAAFGLAGEALAIPGEKCVTNTGVCWANPPGPPGSPCTCYDGSSGKRQ